MKYYCTYDLNTQKVLISKTSTNLGQASECQVTVKLSKKELHQVICLLMDEINYSTLDARTKEGKIQGLINNQYLELIFINHARFKWFAKKVSNPRALS